MKDEEEKKVYLKSGAEAIHYLTKENAAAMQAKGVEARRRNTERRKNMQDIAKWFLNLPMEKANLMDEQDIIDYASTRDVNLTGGEAMVMAQLRKAIEGDTAAATFIRDTAGEKPKDQIEVGGLTMDEYAQSHKPKF